MLIITADDFGKDQTATDNIIACYKKSLITSASAMVFMRDSDRAAEAAQSHGLETGLHINLTLPFDGDAMSERLWDYHSAIARFLLSSRWAAVLYHPLLRNKMAYVYKAQVEEYHRLYHREPTFYNGHHHMHLCVNMLLQRLIPANAKVRRSFTFCFGEKGIVNRGYRALVDKWLLCNYLCTDFFFSIEPIEDIRRQTEIVSLSVSSNVELMVHPDLTEHMDHLTTGIYKDLIKDVMKGDYGELICKGSMIRKA